jgi:hypothetical protein
LALGQLIKWLVPSGFTGIDLPASVMIQAIGASQLRQLVIAASGGIGKIFGGRGMVNRPRGRSGSSA